jgi:hypothetical protein
MEWIIQSWDRTANDHQHWYEQLENWDEIHYNQIRSVSFCNEIECLIKYAGDATVDAIEHKCKITVSHDADFILRQEFGARIAQDAHCVRYMCIYTCF